ncbi:MAG: alpha/beta hydrolase [Bdellovibrionales bacterium]|nr:alpha/beta hydrolase [Bdellovibrionales bacterium]
MNYRTEKVTFKNLDGQPIDARLERPENETSSFAIFAHCFTCSKDVHAATRISRALTNAGLAVLRFDFTGLGNSDGDFANTNFSTNVSDLLCAYKYLSEHHRPPEILIGHSLGGAAVLAGVGSMPTVKMVSTIGAPSDVIHLEKLLGSNVKQIENDGQADVQLAGRTFVIKKQFLDDIRNISIEGKINKMSASLLIFHSPVDQIVSFENAVEIYQAARHPKSIISLDGASHLLDKVEDSEFVANVIASWCKRYMGI